MSTARFAAGDRVSIRPVPCAAHHRVPDYVKGHTGVVERVCAEHGRPEAFIRGDGQPATRLYRIRLHQSQLWPDYQGQPGDMLDIEIFEHWLEPAP